MVVSRPVRLAVLAGVLLGACNAIWGIYDLTYEGQGDGAGGGGTGGSAGAGGSGAAAGGGGQGAGATAGGPSGGAGGTSCLGCAQFAAACVAGNPLDPALLCPGAPADAFQAVSDCVCGACAQACIVACDAGLEGCAGVSVDCQNCTMTALQGTCITQYAACYNL